VSDEARHCDFGVIKRMGMPEKALEKDVLAPPMLEMPSNLRRESSVVAAIII